jgi:hypothetical protein
MSRPPAKMKTVNLEDGLPTVEQARLRLSHELHTARAERCTAVKIIHGYGSSGQGGALRVELQKELRQMQARGEVSDAIPGEEWRESDETAWKWLRRYPEWKKDRDLNRQNRGISIVVF